MILSFHKRYFLILSITPSAYDNINLNIKFNKGELMTDSDN